MGVVTEQANVGKKCLSCEGKTKMRIRNQG